MNDCWSMIINHSSRDWFFLIKWSPICMSANLQLGSLAFKCHLSNSLCFLSSSSVISFETSSVKVFFKDFTKNCVDWSKQKSKQTERPTGGILFLYKQREGFSLLLYSQYTWRGEKIKWLIFIQLPYSYILSLHYMRRAKTC